MPRLLLHIGTEKTGSTAIQSFLHDQKDRLTESGVNFIRAGRRARAHNRVLQARRQGRLAEVMAAIVTEIRNLPGMTHVLSSEMYFGAGLAPDLAAQLPDDIRENTRVLAYIRRQDKFLEALYKQRVKNNKFRGSPNEFRRRKDNVARYSKVLDAYADAFGPENLIVRPFERRQFPGGNVNRDICNILGLANMPDSAFPGATGNVTLSYEVTRLIARIAAATDINTRDIIRHLSQTRPPDAICSNDCFSLRERRDILEDYAEENAYVLATYCPALPRLFDVTDLAPDAPDPLPSPDERLRRAHRAQDIVFQAIADLRVKHPA